MIWNGKYVSLESVIAQVYRDMQLDEQVNIEDMVEWAGEALELIGTPGTLLEQVAVIQVIGYKAKIPTGLHQIQSTFGLKDSTVTGDCLHDLTGFTPMRYSSDVMHHFLCAEAKNENCNTSLTYTVNNDYITTNFEEGAVKVSYWTMPIDTNGYPKIPDQIKYRMAVSSYLKERLAFQKFIAGKMPAPVYQLIERDRLYYIGAAQTAGSMPGLDQMESIKNSWTRMIHQINAHSGGFKTLGEPERRVRHNNKLQHGVGYYNTDDINNWPTFFYYTDLDGNSIHV